MLFNGDSRQYSRQNDQESVTVSFRKSHEVKNADVVYVVHDLPADKRHGPTGWRTALASTIDVSPIKLSQDLALSAPITASIRIGLFFFSVPRIYSQPNIAPSATFANPGPH
jgi:hypothetical protein